jgi:hypothetical protein
MAESLVQVTEGVGKKLRTWNRTIGANSVEEEFTLPGEYPLASYSVIAVNISAATINDHTLQIMAGGSLNVRIRRITIEQSANATTAALQVYAVLRLTTAGTGGTAVTPRPFDTADAASGATAMTLPTAKGTEGVELMRNAIILRQAISATATQLDDAVIWEQKPGMKPIIIPAGTANGIAIKNLVATAAATMIVNVEFVETAFL